MRSDSDSDVDLQVDEYGVIPYGNFVSTIFVSLGYIYTRESLNFSHIIYNLL